MITLAAFNQQQKECQDRLHSALSPHTNGIECPTPDCGAELWDKYGVNGPKTQVGSYIKVPIHCKRCDFTGERFA